MIGADHEMRLHATRDTVKLHEQNSVLALGRRLKNVAIKIGDKLSNEQENGDRDAETHQSGMSSTASGD